jgi:hypothetical protein
MAVCVSIPRQRKGRRTDDQEEVRQEAGTYPTVSPRNKKERVGMELKTTVIVKKADTGKNAHVVQAIKRELAKLRRQRYTGELVLTFHMRAGGIGSVLARTEKHLDLGEE